MSDKSRRKLLKSIAAGSGAFVAGKSLPDNWTRPVVDSVMLPAHAATSGTTYFGERQEIIGSLDSQNGNMLSGLMNALVPEANAALISWNASACVTLVTTTLADVVVQFIIVDDEIGTWTVQYKGQLTVNVDGMLPGNNLCNFGPDIGSHPATVSNVTETSLTLTMGEDGPISCTVGSCLHPPMICDDM